MSRRPTVQRQETGESDEPSQSVLGRSRSTFTEESSLTEKKRFCWAPKGMASPMSWFIWVSALLILIPAIFERCAACCFGQLFQQTWKLLCHLDSCSGTCQFASFVMVFDTFFKFPIYRANTGRAGEGGGVAQAFSSRDGRVEGLYWKRTTIDKGKSTEEDVRFLVGSTPLRCAIPDAGKGMRLF